MTRQEACLALNLIPQIGPVRARRLIAALGGPEQVLQAKVAQLMRIDGIGEAHAQAIAGWEKQVDLLGELAKVKTRGLTLLTETDDLYPTSLRGIRDAPLLLYVWGQILARDHHAIGIVGSRHATVYGLNATKRLGYQIAFAGRTVISGLARGIDTAAHEAALAAKGRTIAIIGSGIGKLYPPENQALAERISQSGAVISEYPVDRIADKQTFPYRNRIVAGWSAGLLVVEAPVRSGSLITAQQAVEQGRSIYAVPGPIDKPTSQGCNRLIQQGAKLVIEAEDILDDLDTLFPCAQHTESRQQASEKAAVPVLPTLSLDEEIVLKAVQSGATHIDEITDASGLTPATVNVGLMRLEMKRLVRALPGRCFEAIS